MTYSLYSKKGLLSFCLSISSFTLFAQQTSYFMDKTTQRLSLNPAFRPATGYVSVPGLGSLSANFHSNALTFDNVIYPAGPGEELVTFLHPDIPATGFLNQLKPNNRINADVTMNLLSVGFFARKSFWTIDVNLRNGMDANIPKGLLEAAKTGMTDPGGTLYNAGGLSLNGSSYLEGGIGYSYPVSEKVTLGARFKMLLGIANVDGYFHDFSIEMTQDKWIVQAEGELNASMKGASAELKKDETTGEDYINGFDIDSPGFGGYGGAMDLGISYKPNERLTFSASALDLGYISWNKEATTTAVSSGEFLYNGFNLNFDDDEDVPSVGNQLDEMGDDFMRLFHFKESAKKKRTTKLRSTVNLAAEYAILRNRLSFGLLSSTRFNVPETFTELTASVNYRPTGWLAATISYSMLHSDFKTAGAALNFSPGWINFFIASDYMLTKVNPQYIPLSQPSANIQFGISIPLAGNKEQ